jgi:hypothetical protein
MHNINTRNKQKLLKAKCQKHMHNIFNILPPSATILKNDKAKHEAALRQYLQIQSFYYVDGFDVCQDNLYLGLSGTR